MILCTVTDNIYLTPLFFFLILNNRCKLDELAHSNQFVFTVFVNKYTLIQVDLTCAFQFKHFHAPGKYYYAFISFPN